MKYLLDTNAVIAILNDPNSLVAQRAKTVIRRDVCISSISAHEFYYGAFKSQRRERNVELVNRLPLQIIEFDTEDARSAGELRAALKIKGSPIGPLDTLIAGQALARDMILVTNNTKEFSRVKGLQIEDWQ